MPYLSTSGDPCALTLHPPHYPEITCPHVIFLEFCFCMCHIIVAKDVGVLLAIGLLFALTLFTPFDLGLWPFQREGTIL